MHVFKNCENGKKPWQKSLAWYAVVVVHNGPSRRLDFRHPLVSGLRWAPLPKSDRQSRLFLLHTFFFCLRY